MFHGCSIAVCSECESYIIICIFQVVYPSLHKTDVVFIDTKIQAFKTLT